MKFRLIGTDAGSKNGQEALCCSCAPNRHHGLVNAGASAVDTIMPTPHGSPTEISQRGSTSESQDDPQKNGNNTYDDAEADHRDEQRLFPIRFDDDLPAAGVPSARGTQTSRR